jgi:hypothetical protein
LPILKITKLSHGAVPDRENMLPILEKTDLKEKKIRWKQVHSKELSQVEKGIACNEIRSCRWSWCVFPAGK